MHQYKYKVAYFDCEYKECSDTGFTFGEDMHEAMTNLHKDYGNNCYGVYLEELDECYTVNKEDLDIYIEEFDSTVFDRNSEDGNKDASDTSVDEAEEVNEIGEEEDDPYDW